MYESAHAGRGWENAARRIGEAIRDARNVLNDFDNVPWHEMDLTYYMAATWTLDIALRDILDAVDALTALSGSENFDAVADEAEANTLLAAGLATQTCTEDAGRPTQDRLWPTECEDACHRCLKRPQDHHKSETPGGC